MRENKCFLSGGGTLNVNGIPGRSCVPVAVSAVLDVLVFDRLLA